MEMATGTVNAGNGSLSLSGRPLSSAPFGRAGRCSRFSLMMSITSCHSHCGQQQMQARL